jgi:hypothetical protein
MLGIQQESKLGRRDACLAETLLILIVIRSLAIKPFDSASQFAPSVCEIVECRLNDMVDARVRQLLASVGFHFATKGALIHVGSNRQEIHHFGGDQAPFMTKSQYRTPNWMVRGSIRCSRISERTTL